MKKNLLLATFSVMSLPSLVLASAAITVPESELMLLLGAGLIGVWIMGKKFKGKRREKNISGK